MTPAVLAFQTVLRNRLVHRVTPLSSSRYHRIRSGAAKRNRRRLSEPMWTCSPFLAALVATPAPAPTPAPIAAPFPPPNSAPSPPPAKAPIPADFAVFLLSLFPRNATMLLVTG